jgi:cytosine deaminase
VTAATEDLPGGDVDLIDRELLDRALAEARAGSDEGGIPVGAVLVVDGEIVGVGRNRRLQRGSVIHHAEMDALEDAGRLPASAYRRATLYTTLSPCPMCAGAIRLYEIPRVVVGEHDTYLGDEALLRREGVEIVVVGDPECRRLLEGFARRCPDAWDEDLGIDPDEDG